MRHFYSQLDKWIKHQNFGWTSTNEFQLTISYTIQLCKNITCLEENMVYFYLLSWQFGHVKNYETVLKINVCKHF